MLIAWTTHSCWRGAAENLFPARMQMALSLGWHIVFVVLRGRVPGDRRVHRVARPQARQPDTPRPRPHAGPRRWACCSPSGAVSGTMLSFEMGMLWPGVHGAVRRRSSACRSRSRASPSSSRRSSSAIYLYGWDRMSPRAHLLAGVADRRLPACGGAFFVVAANALDEPARPASTWRTAAWWTSTRGRRCSTRRRWPQTVHMTARRATWSPGSWSPSVYASGMLRGRRDRYHRLGAA